jgi:hypothetical protein
MTSKTTRAHARADIKDKQVKGLTESAVEALIELGHAAESLKTSLEHMQKAQKNAKPITDQVKKASQQATKIVRSRMPKRS